MSEPNYNMDIARVCHEANRVLQRFLGEPVNLAWDWCNDALQESVVAGVERAVKGSNPKELHDAWRKYRESQGWIYGPEKDAQKKTHPNLVPWSELDPMQRRKDFVFMSIVEILSSATTPPISEAQDESSDTAPAA